MNFQNFQESVEKIRQHYPKLADGFERWAAMHELNLRQFAEFREEARQRSARLDAQLGLNRAAISDPAPESHKRAPEEKDPE